MSMTAEVLQNPAFSNCLDAADPITQEILALFMNRAWKRGCLQPGCSEPIPVKSLTDIEAMNWLETVNKTDNDLGLIIIRIYQQSAWSDLMQLIVRLLELQLLVVPERRSRQ